MDDAIVRFAACQPTSAEPYSLRLVEPGGDGADEPGRAWLEVTRQEMGSVFSDGMESLEVVRGPITIKDIRTIGPKGVTQVGFRLQLPTTKSPQVQLSKDSRPRSPTWWKASGGRSAPAALRSRGTS